MRSARADRRVAWAAPVLRRRRGGLALTTALAAPLLAVGFVAVFDAVMLVTTWQHLRQGAVTLASEAAQHPAPADAIDSLFRRAASSALPVDVAGSGALVLRMVAPNGTVLQQWRRGSHAAANRPSEPSGCPAVAMAAELTVPQAGWVVAAGMVRALVPRLVARAVACAAVNK